MFLISVSSIVVWHYMLIFTHQQYLIVDGIVLSISLQMFFCRDHVRFPQSTHFSQLCQKLTTFLSSGSPLILVSLLGQSFYIFCPRIARLLLFEVVLHLYTSCLMAVIRCEIGVDLLRYSSLIGGYCGRFKHNGQDHSSRVADWQSGRVAEC